MDHDFYVGYAPAAPKRLGKWTKRTVITLVLATVAIGAFLVYDQPHFAASRFEYGVTREYQGVISERPYPILRTADASFLLVAPGKHGLSQATAGRNGTTVRLSGSLIERERDRMLEVLPASLRIAASLVIKEPEPIALGAVKLLGEIVDTKCYLGVMNPGEGKVHRDCAARCISGGAPPAFAALDASGRAEILLLVGTDWRPLNREVVSFVAEPLEIPGELVRLGSYLVLKAEPATFRRNAE
jgi:hypothetical protein